MQFLNLQLNTPPHITRDLKITLKNEATGTEVKAQPFLDGTAKIRNLDSGHWRLKVSHPNMIMDVIDKRIRVFKDQPTFVPVKIPDNIFKDTPVKDIPDADLGPEQARLDDAAEQAKQQAKKLGGQPIYADDWNDLALTVSDVAQSTRDLSTKVSPFGHDHPELVEKIEEVQENLNKFFEVFGKIMTQLQRQIQKMAIQQQFNKALGELTNIEESDRKKIAEAINDLDDVVDDPPHVYSSRLKRAGENLITRFTEILPDDDSVTSKPAVVEANQLAHGLASIIPVNSYTAELQQHKAIDAMRATKGLSMMFEK